MADLELSFDQLGRACADAATAAIEAERAAIIGKLEHLLDTAKRITADPLVIDTLEIALMEIVNV
jgi:hypothetical protein